MAKYAKIPFEQYQYTPQSTIINSIGDIVYAQIDGEIPSGWTEISDTEYYEAVPEPVPEPERPVPPPHTNTDVIQAVEDLRVDLIIAGVI